MKLFFLTIPRTEFFPLIRSGKFFFRISPVPKYFSGLNQYYIFVDDGYSTAICSNVGKDNGSVFRIKIHFLGKMVNFYTICTKRIVKNYKIRHKLWFFCRFTAKIWYNTCVKNLFISNTLNRRISPLECGISTGKKYCQKHENREPLLFSKSLSELTGLILV